MNQKNIWKPLVNLINFTSCTLVVEEYKVRKHQNKFVKYLFQTLFVELIQN